MVSEEGHLEDSALIPYDKIFHNGNGTFVQGTVTAISAATGSDKVVLGDGTEIPYDILVLASGSLWPGPLAFPERPQSVSKFTRDTREKFRHAKHVVLAGGGAVGIGELIFGCQWVLNRHSSSCLEFAGEIKDIWPVCVFPYLDLTYFKR